MMTLNLIPGPIKQERLASERLHHGLNAVVSLAVLVFAGTMALVGFSMALSQHAATVKQQLLQAKQQQATTKGQDISSTTGQLNTTIKLLSTTLGQPRAWGTDTVTVLTGLPSDITVNTLTIQINGQWRLVGIAGTRQSFVELDTVLRANAKLKDVTTKSTASKRVAVPFDFSGTFAAAPKS